MKFKKLLLPIIMIAFVLTSTIAYAAAANLSISASKASGQVATSEAVTYTGKTSSDSVFIKSLNYKMYDVATNTLIQQNTGSPTGAYCNEYAYKIYMPAKAYANIKVTVTLTDKSGATKSKDFNYTMDTTNKFTIDVTPASGKLTKNQSMEMVCTASQNGCGIKNVNLVWKDSNGNQLDSFSTVADDGGLGVGCNKFTLRPMYAPSKQAANVVLTVTIDDIKGVKFSKSFNYTMDVQSTTMDMKVYSQTSDELIPDGSKVAPNQAAYVNTISSNPAVGTRTFYIKLTNTDTNKVYLDKSGTSSYEYGSSPLKYKFSFPTDPGKYRLDCKSVDIYGKEYTKTFYFIIDGSKTPDLSNTLTLTADKQSGSILPKNTIVKFTSTSSNQSVGSKQLVLTVTKDGKAFDTRTANSSNATTVGSNPFNYNYKFTQVGKYVVVFKSTDVKGNVKEGTFEYTIVDDETPVSPIPTDVTVKVTFDPESGATVDEGDKIRVSAASSKAADPMKTIKYTIKDAKGNVVSTQTVTGSKQGIYYDVTVPRNIDTTYFTIEAVGTTAAGVTGSATAKYYLKDSEDEDEDDDIYRGVINPDGDGLVIDLWTVAKERMYELDSTIDFVAYYYNFDKTSKKNVVIEIEVPDGFEVTSRTTEFGSSKIKNDNIIYTIGTVPGKELREVRFSLKAEDDDLSETAQNIRAIIYEDTDDECDASTQRIYIYEVGEKGSRKAFVTGYKDGSFRPDNNITRAEVAAMMARAFGYSANSVSKTFPDVKTTNWAYRFIVGCYNKNVIKGYTDGTFRPTLNITRAELYTMTFRSMEIDEDEQPLFVPKTYKKATSWETPYIAGLERLRMIDDMDDLDKDDAATRAEVVYLISRVQFRNTSSFKPAYYNDVNSSYWNAKDIEAATYNYTFTRKSGGKETVKLGTTFLESDSNYIR